MHRYGKGLNDLIERRSTFLTYLYNTYVGVYIRTSAIIVYWNWVLVTRGVRYRWVLRPKCGTTIPNFVIVVNNGWIIVMMRTGLYWLSRWLIVGGLVLLISLLPIVVIRRAIAAAVLKVARTTEWIKGLRLYNFRSFLLRFSCTSLNAIGALLLSFTVTSSEA